MRRKKVLTMLAALAAFLLVGTPAQALPASGLPVSTAVTAGPWTLDEQTVHGDEVLQPAEGGTHFKASAQAGNGLTQDSYPSVAVHESSIDFTKPGAFQTVIVAPNDYNRFGFYLGYKNPGSGLFLGYDANGWFWQRYGIAGNPWYEGARVPAPELGVQVQITVGWDGKTVKLFVGETEAISVDYSAMREIMTDKLAIKAGTWGEQITDITLTNPVIRIAQLYAISGVVKDSDGNPVADAKVSASNSAAAAVTAADGTFTLENLMAGEYTLTVSKDGFSDISQKVTVESESVADVEFTLAPEVEPATKDLVTEEMTVRVKENFPAVRDYTITKSGAKMQGQPKDVRNVKINGTTVKLSDEDVTFKKVSDTAAQYVLTVKNADKHVDAVLTVELTAKDNTLAWNITKVENKAGKDYPIQTIEFPNLSLVSVTSAATDAQFTGARMSSHTNKNGDTNYAITNQTSVAGEDYIYAFVSGDGLSAGLWSNSEHDGKVAAGGIAGGAKNTRVVADTQTLGSDVSLGLSSAAWYYERTVTDTRERSYTLDATELPQMKIAIAGDENNDGAVNWQDGALAYRSIMNNPYKNEEVPDIVAYRIAMNFGGQAQNPFLTTLDNVKRVALHTDGLGQGVLLKGYANEGHDSGHPDYGDIGARIGGAEDMNTMMEKGAAYGAKFGVHVNASEMYPEAKGFNEDLVRRYSNGNMRYGWNWIDQGIGIDGIYDLASGEREQRFQDLKDQVGDNLDFIYVDVWGNNTSGAEDSWETRKLSKMITDRGWRMTNEWGVANEYDATFQHWATDLSYGGIDQKGQNSQVMRFLRNHQKDSWVGDWPAYGAAAQAPLLGGYNMKDFEGWQGRNDYDAYISNLYTHDVSTKFIQHFTVDRWVNSPIDATAVQDPNTNNGNEQIELSNAAGDKLIIKRATNNMGDAAYRNRTMELNGKVISTGAVRPGNQDKGVGTESYLLPWNWDVNGKIIAPSDARLYHWNAQGGETTWELPNGWNSSSVTVYKLTDLGKTDAQSVPVVNGKITLTAEKETPYVVYQNQDAAEALSVVWSEGMHLVDVGFNGGAQSLEDNWNVTGAGKATIAKSQYSNPMLKTSGTVQATQKLTNLEPGKRYAVYLGIDNRSDGLASVAVKNGSEVLASNGVNRSIAKNYVKAYTHSTSSATVDGSSYFQNVYVWFEAPECGEVTLVLTHEGAGDAYFDDVRVLENGYEGLELNADGTLKSLTNDFENNAQGIWPFVISGSEGVEDNRIHLSELHEPFTQAGWGVKKMDDVLGGTWSVKVNGLTQKNNLLYQTVPSNVRFEPGVEYKISFDYQSGSDGIYAVAIGDGEYKGNVQLDPLGKALGETAHKEFTLTGSLSGDSWFGIYSTSKSPDTQGTSGNAANFGGYKDIVLDNLVIERIDPAAATKSDVETKLAEAEQAYAAADYSDATWLAYQKGLLQAKVLINKTGADAADFAAANALLDALNALMQNPTDNTDDLDLWDIATDAYEVAVGTEQQLTGSEGPASLAQDGQANTFWHSAYGNTDFSKSWYEFQLKEATTVDGLRYLPRPSGINGKLQEVKLELTKSDNSVVTKTAKLDQASVWQKISFEPVADVVKVRMTALHTAGDTPDKFATAAELRLTTPREVELQHTTLVPDVDTLALLVAQAEGLKAADYTADSWKVLDEALQAAKAVPADADVYTVKLAQVNLQNALAQLMLDDPESLCEDPNSGGSETGGIQGGDDNQGESTGAGTGEGTPGEGNNNNPPTPNLDQESSGTTQGSGALSSSGAGIGEAIALIAVLLGVGGALAARRRHTA